MTHAFPFVVRVFLTPALCTRLRCFCKRTSPLSQSSLRLILTLLHTPPDVELTQTNPIDTCIARPPWKIRDPIHLKQAYCSRYPTQSCHPFLIRIFSHALTLRKHFNYTVYRYPPSISLPNIAGRALVLSTCPAIQASQRRPAQTPQIHDPAYPIRDTRPMAAMAVMFRLCVRLHHNT